MCQRCGCQLTTEKVVIIDTQLFDTASKLKRQQNSVCTNNCGKQASRKQEVANDDDDDDNDDDDDDDCKDGETTMQRHSSFDMAMKRHSSTRLFLFFCLDTWLVGWLVNC